MTPWVGDLVIEGLLQEIRECLHAGDLESAEQAAAAAASWCSEYERSGRTMDEAKRRTLRSLLDDCVAAGRQSERILVATGAEANNADRAMAAYARGSSR